MHRLAAFVAVTLAFSVAAQELPDTSPAKEVQSYQGLLGKWRGKGGGVAETPMGTQEFTWTGEGEYTMAFDGHFVMETSQLDVEGMGAMYFKNFYGFDKEQKRYVQVGIDSLGQAALMTLRWLSKDKFLAGRIYAEEGVPTGDRWMTEIGEDTLKVTGWKWLGDGKESKHVWGTFERVAKDTKLAAVDASMGTMPPAPEMDKLARMAGEYTMKGSVEMAPGMAMDITGKERVEAIYGGSVLEMHVHGDPLPGAPAYKGWGAYAWDPAADCYALVFLSNFGEVNSGEARWHDGALIVTSMGVKMGMPAVVRSLVKVDANGKLSEVTDHHLQGAMPPLRAFHAKYTAR